jgi:PAS domain-containing protein
MALTTAGVAPEAWAFTDLDGRIESASRAMNRLLGVGRLRRGDDLLNLFPLPRKALRHDIDAALQGWPVSREVSIDAPGLRERKIRYRVSRRFQQAGDGLCWLLDELSTGALAAAATA